MKNLINPIEKEDEETILKGLDREKVPDSAIYSKNGMTLETAPFRTMIWA